MFNAANRTCLRTCPPGWFQTDNELKTCSKCNSECLTCSAGTREDCSACDINKLEFKYYREDKKTCNSMCPESTFADLNNVCKNCSAKCKSCFGSSINCTGCDNQSYLKGNLCISCPFNYWWDYSNLDCKICKDPCFKCVGSEKNCTECLSPYFFTKETCSLTCGPGFWGKFKKKNNGY